MITINISTNSININIIIKCEKKIMNILWIYSKQHQHMFSIWDLTNKSQIVLKINKSHIRIHNWPLLVVGFGWNWTREARTMRNNVEKKCWLALFVHRMIVLLVRLCCMCWQGKEACGPLCGVHKSSFLLVPPPLELGDMRRESCSYCWFYFCVVFL